MPGRPESDDPDAPPERRSKKARNKKGGPKGGQKGGPKGKSGGGRPGGPKGQGGSGGGGKGPGGGGRRGGKPGGGKPGGGKPHRRGKPNHRGQGPGGPRADRDDRDDRSDDRRPEPAGEPPIGERLLDDDSIAHLTSLPQQAETWIVGRRPLPSVRGVVASSIDLFLVASLSTDAVISTAMIPAEADADVMIDCIARAMLEPDAGPHEARRPKELILDEEVLAEELDADLAALHIDLAIGGSDVLDEFAGAVGGDLAATMDWSFLEDDELQDEDVRLLHTAARELATAAPWHVADENQVLGIEFGMRPETGRMCISLLGQAGEEFGLSLFESLAAYEVYAEEAEQLEADESAPSLSMHSVPMLNLLFQHRVDVTDAHLGQVTTRELPVLGDGWYPDVFMLDPDTMDRRVTTEELRLMAASAMAAARFMTAEGAVFRETDVVARRYSLELDGMPDLGTVTVTAPHGDLLDNLVEADDVEEDEPFEDDGYDDEPRTDDFDDGEAEADADGTSDDDAGDDGSADFDADASADADAEGDAEPDGDREDRDANG